MCFDSICRWDHVELQRSGWSYSICEIAWWSYSICRPRWDRTELQRSGWSYSICEIAWWSYSICRPRSDRIYCSAHGEVVLSADLGEIAFCGWSWVNTYVTQAHIAVTRVWCCFTCRWYCFLRMNMAGEYVYGTSTSSNDASVVVFIFMLVRSHFRGRIMYIWHEHIATALAPHRTEN